MSEENINLDTILKLSSSEKTAAFSSTIEQIEKELLAGEKGTKIASDHLRRAKEFLNRAIGRGEIKLDKKFQVKLNTIMDKVINAWYDMDEFKDIIKVLKQQNP